jgi:hypothetical protein
MRFWNGEVRRNLVGVLDTILSAARAPIPSKSR